MRTGLRTLFARAVHARRRPGVRYGVMLLALAAGTGVGLAVGSTAFGETVCGTTGDISDCAQWGVDGYATRLAIENTGTEPISSFTFTLPPGTTVSGVAGPNGPNKCTWASNQIMCTIAIEPGQTVFVDILYEQNQLPPVGSVGTLTMNDGNGVAQPGQNVSLQTSTACGTNPCTISSTSSSTSTSTSTETSTSTTTTPPGGTPQPCKAHLKVTKSLGSSREEIKEHPDLYVTYPDAAALVYVIHVHNDSNCPATGVVVTDMLPHVFDCAGGSWRLFEETPKGFRCKGEGRDVRVQIGTLGPDETATVIVSGKFRRERTTSNTARATATNAPGEHSDHIHVDVVSKKQFEKDRGAINH